MNPGNAPSLIAMQFALDGFALVVDVLSESDLTMMEQAFEGAAGRRQRGLPHGFATAIANHAVLGSVASKLASASARLVRIIAFDKSPIANWFVPWHQDRSIALVRRLDAKGFDNWTVKDGLVHAEPPEDILAGMVTLRVHLDDCGKDVGPLEIIPGSHLYGRLTQTEIKAASEGARSRLCLAKRGEMLAIRPLLLHRSRRALNPTRRRVLHLEYATKALPQGLHWSLDDPTAGAPVH